MPSMTPEGEESKFLFVPYNKSKEDRRRRPTPGTSRHVQIWRTSINSGVQDRTPEPSRVQIRFRGVHKTPTNDSTPAKGAARCSNVKDEKSCIVIPGGSQRSPHAPVTLGVCKSCHVRRRAQATGKLPRSGLDYQQVDCACSIPSIVTIDPSAAERLQALNFFTADYPPYDRKHVRHHTFWTEMLATDISQEPLLTNAIDAVTFSYLAKTQASSTLECRAREAYGRWVRMLARAVELHTVRRRSTNISSLLQSILTMGLICRFPNPITSSAGEHGTWHGHVWACHRFLDASGPRALDFSRPVDRTIYFNLKATALYLGLSHRQFFVSEQPEWKEFLNSLLQDTRFAPTARWQQITDGLPELLHQVDRVNDETDIDSLYQALSLTRKNLEAIMPDSRLLGSIKIADKNLFDETIDEHSYILRNKVFTTFYTFIDLEEQDHNRTTIMKWCVDLLVGCAILKLLAGSAELRRYEAEDHVFARASDLARSVWYMSKHDTVANAKFTRMCLLMAVAVYQELGVRTEREHIWAKGCADAVNDRISRMTASGRKSLCPIGELGVGFVNGCQWRGQ